AMASYAAEGASLIAERLRPFPDLLSAACTFPTVATSPYIGVRALAAILPFRISMAAIIRVSRRYGPASRPAILGWLIVFLAAYAPLALALLKSNCLSK